MKTDATTRLLAIIARTAATIGAAGDLESALRALLAGIVELTAAESAGVRLLDHTLHGYGSGRMYVWSGGEHYHWSPIDPLGPDTAQVLSTGRAVITPDTDAQEPRDDPTVRYAVDVLGIRSSLIVPLRAAGRLLGTVHADAKRTNAFDLTSVVPLQVLADHAGGAVEQAFLRARAERERAEKVAILERMDAAFFALDRDWRFTYTNVTRTTERLWTSLARLGLDPQDLIGKHVWEAVPELRGTPFEAAYRQAMDEQHPVKVEAFFPATNQWLEAHVYPDADGLSIYAHDVTERKRLEAERDVARDAQARAEAAVRTGRAVVHALASPLGVVLGLVELWHEEPSLSTAMQNDVQMMLAALDRARELLHQLGTIARYAEEATPVGPQLDLANAREVPPAPKRPPPRV